MNHDLDRRIDRASQEPQAPSTHVSRKPSFNFAAWLLITFGIVFTVVSSALYYTDAAEGIAAELGNLASRSILLLLLLLLVIRLTAKERRPSCLWCFAFVFALYTTVGSSRRMIDWYHAHEAVKDMKAIGYAFLEDRGAESPPVLAPSPDGATDELTIMVKMLRQFAHDLEADAAEVDAISSQLDLERMLSAETLTDTEAIDSALQVLQSYETAFLEYAARVQRRLNDVKSNIQSMSIGQEQKKRCLLQLEDVATLTTAGDTVRSFVHATRSLLEFMADRQGHFYVKQGGLFFQDAEDVEKYNTMLRQINMSVAQMHDMLARAEQDLSGFLAGL